MQSPIHEISVHLVGALYPTEQAARYAFSRLEEEGFADKQVRLVGPPPPAMFQGIPAPRPMDVSSLDDFLDMVRADLLQAGAGAEAGLADAASIAATNVRVFLAHPVLQTLLALGYESTLGLAQESPKIVDVAEDEFSRLVRDAVESDFWAVILRPEDDSIADEALELMSMLYD